MRTLLVEGGGLVCSFVEESVVRDEGRINLEAACGGDRLFARGDRGHCLERITREWWARIGQLSGKPTAGERKGKRRGRRRGR